MDYQTLHAKTVAELCAIAKENGIKLPSHALKADICSRLLEALQQEKPAAPAQEPSRQTKTLPPQKKDPEPQKEKPAAPAQEPPRQTKPFQPQGRTQEKNAEPQTGAEGKGTLEIQPDGYGYLRGEKEDFYISQAQIRRCGLKQGDVVEGYVRPKQEGNRYGAMVYVKRINGMTPEKYLAGETPAPAPEPKIAEPEPAPEPAAEPEPSVPAPAEESAVAPEYQNLAEGAGMLDIHPDGYGYLRGEQEDYYISGQQIRRFELKQGDRVEGRVRPKQEGNRCGAMVYVSRVNGMTLEQRAAAVAAEEQARREARPADGETGMQDEEAGMQDEEAGILDIQPDGYGYLRTENCQQGRSDIYISNAQIRRYSLKQGDLVEGKVRPPQEGNRCGAMIFVSRVNGETPDRSYRRRPFDTLIPVYPDRRLRLENPKNEDLSLRLIDILAPIGKGQRGLIVSQPKAGKTTLIKKVANAITENNPECKLIVLLIDERPEEVTDMKRSISGEVVYSTFDEEPINHTRVAEMVLEHAMRRVEMGQDVVILLDSITRLARAYNLVITPTGRTLSGGMDPGALYRPKKFFGAARSIENGGSLTIIATALVETGSRMDDMIYEEFKGTGNMELHLDRKLSDKRIFPAIDPVRSGTRREDLLMTPQELEGAYTVRRMLANGSDQQNAELLISLMRKSENNEDFLSKIKGWMAAYEKEGFVRKK